ncbi:hypothetical protein C449_10753 [Halococcus saccharolyticus DSM 5350]|uniref:Uncharacterized protein n=2 Tax=Halococcus saccharolyticus TaxID=62319 RepID=M0ME50_9EURY|nr:hypothetical protein C449_10753 [Halococcus saccharolyticus DSM 5350]
MHMYEQCYWFGMSTPTDDVGSISLRRADFLAVLWAAMGIFWLVSALGDGLPAKLLSADTFFIANGIFMFGIAVYYRRRPDSVRRGHEPTPTSWLVLGGAVIGVLALFFVVVVAVQAGI